jgi:hypothetical protein
VNLLSTQLLERLAACWAAQSVPILGRLQRGLSDAEMDGIVERIPLSLTPEARVWWGWRNGVPVERSGSGPLRQIIGVFEYLPLEEAVVRYQQARATAAYTAEREEALGGAVEMRSADRWWEPTWLPVLETGSAGLIACDCSEPERSATPILYVDWGAFEEQSRTPRAPSFGEMVTRWIDVFEKGFVRYRAEDGRWELNRERMIAEGYLSGLV